MHQDPDERRQPNCFDNADSGMPETYKQKATEEDFLRYWSKNNYGNEVTGGINSGGRSHL